MSFGAVRFTWKYLWQTIFWSIIEGKVKIKYPRLSTRFVPLSSDYILCTVSCQLYLSINLSALWQQPSILHCRTERSLQTVTNQVIQTEESTNWLWSVIQPHIIVKIMGKKWAHTIKLAATFTARHKLQLIHTQAQCAERREAGTCRYTGRHWHIQRHNGVHVESNQSA